jgi:nucleoid-associated protein YgaU
MRVKGLWLCALLLLSGTAVSEEQPGSVDIRSTLVGTRVYLDDAYVGDADLFLEEVLPGDHIFTLRQGSQRIRGQFRIKPGDLLMLEGRFEEDRIVDLKEAAKEEAAKRLEADRKAEAERKAVAAAAATEAEKEKEKRKRQEKQAKAPEEKKKADARKPAGAAAKPAKSTGDELRNLHVNILRSDFAEAGGAGFEVKVTSKTNQKTVSNFTDSKSTSGKLYRNKQNIMLCEAGGCSRDWTGRFFYIDETGKRDAFLIRWKETVFTGITPAGTSKTEMDLCLNGDCKRVVYRDDSHAPVQANLERYVLTWTKTAFIIRRADLVKEISDAGEQVPDF